MHECDQPSTNKVYEMCSECRNRNKNNLIRNGFIVAVKVKKNANNYINRVKGVQKRKKSWGGGRNFIYLFSSHFNDDKVFKLGIEIQFHRPRPPMDCILVYVIIIIIIDARRNKDSVSID